MFKVIYLSLSADDTLYDGHVLDMFPQQFVSKNDAMSFIHSEIAEDWKTYLMEGSDNPSEAEVNIQDFDNEGYVIYEVNQGNDLVYKQEFKVVEL